MSLEDFDLEVVDNLTKDEEEQDNILHSLTISREPFRSDTEPIQSLQVAYARLGYWYAYTKRRKRASEGEARQDWQFYEDYLEAAVKALDSALISTMHLNKQERGHY